MTSLTMFLPKLEYCVGEVISGRLQVIASKPQKLRGIRLRVRGTERSSFTISVPVTHVNHNHGAGNQNSQAHAVHTSHESRTVSETNRFLEAKVNLFGLEFGSKDEMILTPGTYVYPFEFQIPYGCLPSYKSSVGSIYYEIKAYIEVPGFFKFDIKERQNITVLLSNDVSSALPAAITAPRTQKVSKNPTLGSGTIEFEVTSAQGFAQAGNSLMFRVKASNQSSKSVRGIEYHVLAKTDAKAQQHNTTSNKKIASSKYARPVAKGEIWEEEFTIPLASTVHPSFVGQLLSCEYFLHVSLDISWSRDLRVDVPIAQVFSNVSTVQLTTMPEQFVQTSGPVVSFSAAPLSYTPVPTNIPQYMPQQQQQAYPPQQQAYPPQGQAYPPQQQAYPPQQQQQPPQMYPSQQQQQPQPQQGYPPQYPPQAGYPPQQQAYLPQQQQQQQQQAYPSQQAQYPSQDLNKNQPPPPSYAGGAPLPPGWERDTDDQGRIFYIHHDTKKTQWEKPTA